MTRRDWSESAWPPRRRRGPRLGGLSIGQILPPPLKFSGEIRETIQYTKFPPTDPTADLWWNTRAGTAVKVSDFDRDWKGATGVWRGLLPEQPVGSRHRLPMPHHPVKRENQYFLVPGRAHMPAALPEGFNLFFDDANLDAANGGTRIVVLFDPLRPSLLLSLDGTWSTTRRRSATTRRTPAGQSSDDNVFGVDPVYCISTVPVRAHGARREHEQQERAQYVGAWRVHGPRRARCR